MKTEKIFTGKHIDAAGPVAALEAARGEGWEPAGPRTTMITVVDVQADMVVLTLNLPPTDRSR